MSPRPPAADAAHASSPSGDEVRAYYQDRSREWAQQFPVSNRRQERQRAIVTAAIPRGARRVLILGCGSGDLARHIASRIARSARVVATDVSDAAVALARRLHPHGRVEYRVLDALRDAIEDEFDVVILPDIYEHIPLEMRRVLHERLARAMAARAMCILTLPSPGHQRHLRELGTGLQIIDEVVTLDDLRTMAADLGGEVTYFSLIHVWRLNDYVHAVIERGAPATGSLVRGERTPLKLAPDAAWRRRLQRISGWRLLKGLVLRWRATR